MVFVGVLALSLVGKKVVFVMLPVALHKLKGCDPGPVPATWLKGKRTLDGLRGAGGDWSAPCLALCWAQRFVRSQAAPHQWAGVLRGSGGAAAVGLVALTGGSV